MLVDGCLCGLSLYLAWALRTVWHVEIFGGTREIFPFEYYVWLLAVVVPAAPFILRMLGFYNRPLLASRQLTAWQLLKASFWMPVMVALSVWVMRDTNIARAVVVQFGVIGFGMLYLKEELLLQWRRSSLGQSQSKRRLVLVGTPAETARLRADLLRGQHHELAVAATLDLNEERIESLVSLLHEHSANGVILTAKHTYFGQIEQAIEVCEREGVEVWLLADFFKTQVSQTTVDEFFGRPMLVFRSGPEISWPALIKQGIDFTGALLLLATLGSPMLLVAAIIRLTSPGPVLFRQQRSGLNGQPFTMLKFRSMVTDAEQLKHELEALNEMSGPVFKVTQDPRVTPIGRFLRRYSIDELPQLINVLRGEMSLVGPRPLPVDEVRRFDDFAHRRRLSVRPGLTCLWQVSGRNEVRDFRDWVRLDLEYIDNWSLWLDLKILVRTIPAVVTGSGAK